MKLLLERIFLKNWPRKLVALVSAFFIWLLVSQTLTVTRTLPDIPVRIINVPSDKTIVGMLPNGLLKNRISLTLTGKKSVIQDLRPTDLEVVINADGHEESWIATIDKRNLISTNQQIDIRRAIASMSTNDLFIKMSNLITEEIPITIMKPIGDPPKGYQFLDVWPKYLTQKVSGPADEVRALKERGLELIFNLNRISQAELDSLYQKQGKRDEISYKVPNSWKKVSIPFRDDAEVPLNDPRAQFLRIDFLKQELVPLGIELPITIFFPVKYSQAINPQTYSLATNPIVEKKNGLKLLTLPLYVRDVSRLFLDIVRNNLLLLIVADPHAEGSTLNWAIEFVDEKALEAAFVKASMQGERFEDKVSEPLLRHRFREYLRILSLYYENGEPLDLTAKLEASTINLSENGRRPS